VREESIKVFLGSEEGESEIVWKNIENNIGVRIGRNHG